MSPRPRKYGICVCIPADVNSVEWSSARGTSDAEGHRRCPFSSKKARKPFAQLGGRTHEVDSTNGRACPGPCATREAHESAPARPAFRSSQSSSVSAFAAASLATCIASPTSRRARKAAKPWETPAASPVTFFTGAVITVETARTAVSALSAIETALSVTTSSLSSWSFTRSTVPPALTITGRRSRSVPLMNDESRAKVPPSRTSM